MWANGDDECRADAGFGLYGAGIVVGASGITIDLRGFSLRGDGEALDYGIDDTAGYGGLTVKDGLVRNFDDGIRAAGGADGVQVVNVVAAGNIRNGIIISGDSALVKSSTADGNAADGIEFAGVDGQVKSSTADGNRGIGIFLINGGRVTSSTADGKGQGFLIEAVPAEIASSTASGNVGSGIVVLADSASITSTITSGNGGRGILVAGDGPATLKDNQANGNGFAGGPAPTYRDSVLRCSSSRPRRRARTPPSATTTQPNATLPCSAELLLPSPRRGRP